MTSTSPTPIARGVSSPKKTPLQYLPASLKTIDHLDADTLVIGVCEEIRPLKGAAGFVDWRMCGEISNLIRNQSFTGQPGEVLLLSGRGRLSPVRLVLLGWGRSSNLDAEINPRCEQLIQTINKAASQKVAVILPEPSKSILSPCEQILKLGLGERLVGIFESEDLI
jgi:hypothetical protein